MTSPILTRLDLATASRAERTRLTRRSVVPDPTVTGRVADICAEVAEGGDEAVADLAARFGGGFRRVTPEELSAAEAGLSPEVKKALADAIAAVRKVHDAQIPSPLTVTSHEGVEVTREWTPLRRIGAYVPGGKASYPSTVVMTVVPAVVAGVSEIVVTSPEGPDGTVSPVMLAACSMAGATEVWSVGGAQAIAALAYGTESLRPVQKIVGPGNAYVTAAKLAVFGTCAIDLPAGPSEVLVLADSTADPRLVAIDLLCQAEHGPDSPAVLVTTDDDLIAAVERELTTLLPNLDRSEILGKALADHGTAVLAPDHASAVEFADEYSSEHVSILTEDPEADAAAITSAGSVYVGRWAPESAGDYATGANHVLPTGGLAAACGPLSTEDYGSWRQVQRISREGLTAIAPVITNLATAEGLSAHRLAAQFRLEIEEKQ